MPRKQHIEFIKTNEPTFIRKFKESTGILKEDTVDSKRHECVNQDDTDDEKVDEQPQIVLDLSSGVTAVEAQEFLDHNQMKKQLKSNDLSSNPSTKSDNSGRILFRTLTERLGQEDSSQEKKYINDTETKKQKQTVSRDRDRSPIKSKYNQNHSLLSFDVNEENDL